MMKCPTEIKSPFHYKTYECKEDEIFINYYASYLLVKAPFYNYLRTGVKNAPDYRTKFSYLVPIYKFMYYDIDNPSKVLKTYTYEELFQFSLVSEQYKNNVPYEIKKNWDNVDKNLYDNLLLLPITDKLYDGVNKANEYLQKSLEYGFTFQIPSFIDVPKQQKKSICWSRDTIITISRNAQTIINAYQFNGLFQSYHP